MPPKGQAIAIWRSNQACCVALTPDIHLPGLRPMRPTGLEESAGAVRPEVNSVDGRVSRTCELLEGLTQERFQIVVTIWRR
jgi:hypothetical protein